MLRYILKLIPQKMKKLICLLIILPVFLFTSCDYENDNSAPMTLGDSDAPVFIEEFSDIECPACGMVSPQVEELAKNNPDIVRLDFYHFPLSYHEYAFMGAEAAECAADQGEGWEYLAMAFENNKNLSDEFFYAIAEDLELDMDAFSACLDNSEKKEKILSHLREGKTRQIPGTPSLFVNGEMIKWSGYEQMEAYIQSLVN